jgi:hypothetical protein
LLPGIPDTAASAPHPALVCVRVRPLQELVAGAAAAGRMEPTPMGAAEPGGQPAAELATEIGHRRPGEGTGLLEAEVVGLQPGDLTGLPAAETAWATWSGSTPTAAQVSLGPGAQLTSEVA